MNDKEQSFTFLIVTTAVTAIFLCGFLFGKGCNEKQYAYLTKRDTVTEVKIVPRQVFVKPDVKVKSIMVPFKDTFYVSEKVFECKVKNGN